jgi:hypothetical protein
MMTLTYTVTEDFKVILKSGTKKIDEVGAFESEESANYWGTNVCEKYNAAEYANVKYPDQLPNEA